jgi:hypothetical protein
MPSAIILLDPILAHARMDGLVMVRYAKIKMNVKKIHATLMPSVQMLMDLLPADVILAGTVMVFHVLILMNVVTFPATQMLPAIIHLVHLHVSAIRDTLEMEAYAKISTNVKIILVLFKQDAPILMEAMYAFVIVVLLGMVSFALK